jgi:hypothetical protein
LDIELRIVVLKNRHATATIKGTGPDIDHLTFVVSGAKNAVNYLAEVFAGEHSGYTGYTGPWGGKIGTSMPKLLDVLAQLDHDSPGQKAELTFDWVKQPAAEDLPEIEELPEGEIA